MDRISFGKKNENRAGEVFCHLLDLALWLILLLAFWMALYQFQAYTRQEQKKSLIRALQKDIAQCYALEGMYPPSLDYLKKRYGLTYDESFFYVDYQPLASNLYPDVTVLEKSRKQK